MTDPGPAIAFLGAYLPQAELDSYPVHSAAGQQFQAELLRVLGAEGLAPDLVLTVRPAASFPADRRLFFRRQASPDAHRPVLLPFINLAPLKTITAALAATLELVRWSRRHRGRSRFLLGYNATNPSGWALIAAARLTGARSAAIIADVPVPGSGDVPDTLPRRLEAGVHRAAVRRLDAVVALTPDTIRELVPRAPSLLLEGGVPADMAAPLPPAPPAEGGGLRLLYSGRLTDMAGIDLLLAGFAQVRGDGWRLRVTGWGAGAERVRRAAEADPRIAFLGFVERAQLLREYAAADLLVNPHRTDLASANHVFSSKVLEYLAAGRPVLSTARPWMAAEYGHCCHVLDDESPEGLAAALKRIAAIPEGERHEHARRARAWVLAEKSWDRQGVRLAAFLRAVAAPGRAAPVDAAAGTARITRTLA